MRVSVLSSRSRQRVAAVAVSLVVLTAGTSATYLPRSGDVDEDGRLTTRDALRIMDFLTWPERDRLFDFIAACDVNGDGGCDRSDAEAIARSAAVDSRDFDGDGVPNEQDCSPYDDRLATDHTFYLDGDRDQVGNSAQSYRMCTVVPSPPFVAWGGDPEDTTPYVTVPIAPKGDRTLAVDFADSSAGGYWRPDLAKEIGADATSLRVAWRELEPAPGQYAGAEALQQAATTYREHGLAVSLTVSPISGPLLVVPEDLRVRLENGTAHLSDPAVVQRFKNVLTFTRQQLGDLPLVSLQIGHEVDGYLSQAPLQAWTHR
jgi:hypothetical protein